MVLGKYLRGTWTLRDMAVAVALKNTHPQSQRLFRAFNSYQEQLKAIKGLF